MARASNSGKAAGNGPAYEDIDHPDHSGLPSIEPPPDRTPRGLREERQARVGILRNSNRTGLMPPRKAQLTGRWLKMQSSRRPRSAGGASADAGPSGSKEDGPGRSFAQMVENAALRQGLIATGKDGIEAIDIAGLMASVAGIGRTVPLRKPFAPVLYDDPLEGRFASSATRYAGSPPLSGAEGDPHAAISASTRHPGASEAMSPLAAEAARTTSGRTQRSDEARAPTDRPSTADAPVDGAGYRHQRAAGHQTDPIWIPDHPEQSAPRQSTQSEPTEADLHGIRADKVLKQSETQSTHALENLRLGSHRSRSPAAAARRMSHPPQGYRDAGWGIIEEMEGEEPAPPAKGGWRAFLMKLIRRFH